MKPDRLDKITKVLPILLTAEIFTHCCLMGPCFKPNHVPDACTTGSGGPHEAGSSGGLLCCTPITPFMFYHS